MKTDRVVKCKEIIEDKIFSIAKDCYTGVSINSSVALMEGVSSMAILYSNLYLHNRKEEDFERTQEILNLILDYMESGISSFSLCSGLAGNAMVLNNIKKLGIFEMDIDEILADCDRHLIKGFHYLIDKGDLDFLHGSLGIIMYLYQRNESDGTNCDEYKVILERFLQEVNKFLLRVNNFSIEKDKEIYVNCGFAHGLLSIILFLSKNLKYSKFKIKRLIEQLVDLQLKFHSVYPGSLSVFPSMVKLSNTIIPEEQYLVPLGWCYGDLIAAYTLLKAGEAINDSNLKDKAKIIGLKAIARITSEDSKVIDACFCHGSSGVAFLSKKMYEITGEISFKKAYSFWIKRTVEFCNFEGGIGGYKKFSGETFENNAGILDGALGPSLVLLENLNQNCSSWSEVFMLD